MKQIFKYPLRPQRGSEVIRGRIWHILSAALVDEEVVVYAIVDESIQETEVVIYKFHTGQTLPPIHAVLQFIDTVVVNDIYVLHIYFKP